MIDAAEALTNAATGLCVSLAATYYLLPIWGLATSLTQSAGITGMFFSLSCARAYALRRFFRSLGN